MDIVEYVNGRTIRLRYPRIIGIFSKFVWVEKLYFYTLDLTGWKPPLVPDMRLNVTFVLGDEADIVPLTSDPHLEASGELSNYVEKIRSGQKLLLGKRNGEIIFYLWVVKGSKKLMNKIMVLQSHEFAIERGFTRKEYRGHGLFVYGLNYLFPLLKAEGATSCLTEIATHNIPMIKTAKKIGFNATANYYYWVNTPFTNIALVK